MVTIMSENFAPMRTGTYPRKATMTRILIVEDEESYREPLVYQLTREGYDVSRRLHWRGRSGAVHQGRHRFGAA